MFLLYMKKRFQHSQMLHRYMINKCSKMVAELTSTYLTIRESRSFLLQSLVSSAKIEYIPARAERNCHFSITMDTEATIHYTE